MGIAASQPDGGAARTRFSIPTRGSLLSRIKNWEDAESWHEFYRLYERFIFSVARQAGLTVDESNEAVQETFCQVAKNIPEFSYDPSVGSFKSWLMHTARWHVMNQFRKRERAGPHAEAREHPSDRTATVDGIEDPRGSPFDRRQEEEWRLGLREAALQRLRSRVKPKQFQAFHLYVIQEAPVERIQEALGVERSYVYTAKYRVGRLFAAEMARLEREYQ